MWGARRERLTDNVLEVFEVITRAELRPEFVDAHTLPRFAQYRIAHCEDVEVPVDADWPRACQSTEERDFALDTIQPVPFLVNVHRGRHIAFCDSG